MSNSDSECVGLNDQTVPTESQRNDFKTRRSMDFGLHNDLAEVINIMKELSHKQKHDGNKKGMDSESHGQRNNNGSLDDDCDAAVAACSGDDELVKGTESTRSLEFDSDDDTFACAESDCEPNQFYLDEMIEDIHPERLSLFDYRRTTSSKIKDENDDSESNHHHDSYLDQSLHNSSTRMFVLDDDDDFVRNGISNSDEDSESESLDEDDIVDDSLPKTIENGRGRRSGLNNFGNPAVAGPGRSLLRQPSQKAVWGK